MASLAALPPGTAPDAIRARLQASPATPAFEAAEQAVRALGFELRDAAGQPVPDVRVLVSVWSFPIPGDAPAELRAAVERDLAEAGVSASGYVLVVTPDMRRVTRADRSAA